MEHVFYHRDLDGLFSAYWYGMYKRYQGKVVSFASIQYSEEIAVPEGASAVTFLDFCPPEQFFVSCQLPKTVLDHHPIAKEMAEKYPSTVTFFSEKAGACLGVLKMYLGEREEVRWTTVTASIAAN